MQRPPAPAAAACRFSLGSDPGSRRSSVFAHETLQSRCETGPRARRDGPARVTASRALVASCCLTSTLALGTVRPVPTVILLRHGKSSWSDPTLADLDRPLAPRGERAVRKMAKYI